VGPDGAVTFGKRGPVVGDHVEEQSTLEMKLTISGAGEGGTAESQQLDLRESETRHEEVLAAAGLAATRLKVTWVTRTEAQTENGKTTARPSPLAGKTLVVAAQSGKIAATTESGTPAPPAQARQVQTTYALLGQPDPVLARMPARPLRPGEKVPELEQAVREEIAAKAKDMPGGTATVTFKEARGEEGVFDVVLLLTKTDPPSRMTMRLAGELRLSRATGQIVAFSLAGPIEVTAAPGETAKITGSGTLKLDTVRRRP
jgi:hypothetical protein